jgi:type IV pilus assembly protein PilW
MMVAVTIGLIILVGVATIFSSSRSTYQTDEGMSRLQENARLAVDYMNREIRLAGYFGCLRDTTREAVNVFNNLASLGGVAEGGFANDLHFPVQGFEYNATAPAATYNITAHNPDPVGVAANNWTPNLNAALQNRVLPGTDVVVIRRASDAPGLRLASPYSSATQLILEPGATVTAGDVMMVSDCSKASIFQATAVGTGAGSTVTVTHGAPGPSPAIPGNACATWLSAGTAGCPPDAQRYGEDAQLVRATTTAFYVGRGSSGSPALFMTINDPSQNGGLRHLELAEGVEHMQILYGVDTDAATNPIDFANQYMTATAVSAATTINATTNFPQSGWARVMSVRINLLVRTSNVVGTADQIADSSTYNLGGTIINPLDDNRRRRVFTTTITIRNRIPG